MFPHMALSARLINDKKEFYIIQNPIVINGIEEEETVEKSYTRGTQKRDLHPYRSNLSYIAGYANTLMLIKDKKLRNDIAMNHRFYKCKMCSGKMFFENASCHRNSFYNLFCIFNMLNFANKIKFIIQLILFFTLYRIIYIYNLESYNEESGIISQDYRMRLFYVIKLKLFKFKYKYKGIK